MVALIISVRTSVDPDLRKVSVPVEIIRAFLFCELYDPVMARRFITDRRRIAVQYELYVFSIAQLLYFVKIVMPFSAYFFNACVILLVILPSCIGFYHFIDDIAPKLGLGMKSFTLLSQALWYRRKG